MIGVVYIAVVKDGKGVEQALHTQLRMARLSAISMKEMHPSMNMTLFTNLPTEPSDYMLFDSVVSSTGPLGNLWAYKHKCLEETPYDRTLHIDADTYIMDGISEVFDVLDRFDLAIPVSTWYMKNNNVNVPMCFPELAGGFFTWVNNEKMKIFFRQVSDRCKEWDSHNDEGVIRETLYNSNIRFAVLPQEYNCLVRHPGYLYGSIKVAHGRVDTLREEANAINRIRGIKLFTGGDIYELERHRRYRKYFRTVKVHKYGHMNE
jgi:hypothetical protein